MPRDLKPVTVYLDDAARAEAERRAAHMGVAVGTLLRMILTGVVPPLDAS